MGIDIIIVNYYSKKKLFNVLKSIDESVVNNVQLNVIIINNSPNESLEDLASKDELLIINNSANKGFGYACNQAIPFLKNEFVLLLNPDTILFNNTLAQSIEYLQHNNEVTVLGVKHFSENGIVVPSCSRFPTLRSFFFDSILLSKVFPKVFSPLFLMKDWNHLESKFVDQVMGAYLMIRKSFIDSNGLMDERYFVFLEDMDFCKKVWEKGGKVFYNSNISLVHEGASSTEGVSDKKTAFLMQGKLKYCKKHFPLYKYLLVVLLVTIVEPFLRFIYMLLFKTRDLGSLIKGYTLFLKQIRLV